MAQIGKGSKLSINTGTSAAPTWTAFGKILDIGQSGRQVGTEETTDMDSTSRTYIGTLLDNGSWKIDFIRVGSDVGQVALETAFASAATTQFKVELPKVSGQTTSGDTYTFDAIVTDCNYSLPLDKKVSGSTTLKVSGDLTLTAGA